MKPQCDSIVAVMLAFCVVASIPAQAEEVIPPAITPNKVISLMEDPDFKDFTVSLNKAQSLTANRQEIWKLEKGQLHVIGKAFGYLRTNRKFRDDHLVMEYRWGEDTWKPRLDRARDCGLLVHGHGPDGSLGDTWLSSIEAQLIEGGSGDILVLQGKKENGDLIPSRLSSFTIPFLLTNGWML